MKLERWNFFSILLVAALGFMGRQVVGQAPQTGAAGESTPKKPQRTIPFRGMIGKTDSKKQIFTLVNKSNDLIRTFKVTKETRFERDGSPAKFDMLKPDLQVRGSCFKTGERRYTAKLVRWVTKKPEPTAKKKPAE